MIHETDVDTIIDDIHRTRERLAEKFGGDVKAILADARRRQAASGRPVWQGTPTINVDNRSSEADGT